MPACKPYTKRRTPAENALMVSFVRQVKAAMRSQGINQSRLAELTGIDDAGISLTLNGGHSPRLDRMAAIAAALGMRVEILLVSE
jgi:transcriptional regulator with XRE-family HTH domain